MLERRAEAREAGADSTSLPDERLPAAARPSAPPAAAGGAGVREARALAALALVLGWTAVLWALALWPLPSDAPEWLARTRAVCFGTTSSGLPDASGWLVLTLQPGMLLGVLFAGFGRSLRQGLARLARAAAGRAVLLSAAGAILFGLGAAVWRVSQAREPSDLPAADEEPPPDYPRLDRPAPALELTDQHGRTVSLAQFRGRPVLVTFAYAHCQTVCPVLVHDVLAARRAAAQRRTPGFGLPGAAGERPGQSLGPPPAVLIVTLDPERDVPARLPAIARSWGLLDDELVLSGPVATVEAALDAWRIGRARDPRTGTVAHPPLIYLVDRDGRIAYAAIGGVRALTSLLQRL